MSSAAGDTRQETPDTGWSWAGFADGEATTPPRAPGPAPATSTGRGAFAVGFAAAFALAIVVVSLAVFARDHPRVTTAASLPPTVAGIAPDQQVPELDAHGDPLWLPIPIVVPRATTTPLPSALTADEQPDPSTGSLVTPERAAAIVASAWPLRTAALSANSGPRLAAFEAGPALEADLGVVADRSSPALAPLTKTAVLVPAQQSSWPLDFLAEGNTTAYGAPWVQILVFERTGPSQPWTLVLTTGYSPGGGPQLDTPDSSGGYATAVATDTVAALPGSLAADYQQATDTGNIAIGFAPGTWTDGAEAGFAAYGQGRPYRNGLIGHYIYQAGTGSDDVFSFRAAGHTLACGVVRLQETWTPPSGKRIAQDARRDQWGPSVAPGRYRAVVESRIAEPCFLVPAAAPGGPAPVTSVLGGQSGLASLVAVP